MLLLWFSVFQFDTMTPSQVKTRWRRMYPDHPCVDITELVPNCDGNEHGSSLFAPKEGEPIDITRNLQVTPTSQENDSHGLSSIRQAITRKMFLKEQPISLWPLEDLAQKSNIQHTFSVM